MLKSAATVLSGTIAAQLIALMMMPVISRLYAPEAFGAFQMLASVTATLLPLAALRMEFALLRVKSNQSVATLVTLCTLLNIIVAVLVFIGVTTLVPFIAPNQTGALWTSWVLPVTILAAGFFQTLSYLPVRDARYKVIALSKVTQSGSFAIGSAALGAISMVALPIYLVFSEWVGRVLGSAIIFTDWIRRHGAKHLKRPNWQHMGRLLHHYRQYPIFSTPSSLISAVSLALPVFWMSFFHSPEATGQFGMAWRVGAAPLMMISFALSQVVNAHLSSGMRGNASVASTFIPKVSLIMGAIGLVPICLIFFFAPPLVTAILGPQWAEAGQMFKYMSPLFLSILTMGPVNMALVIVGHASTHLAWETGRLVALLTTLTLLERGTPTPETVVAQYSAVMLVMGILYIFLAYYMTRKVLKP